MSAPTPDYYWPMDGDLLTPGGTIVGSPTFVAGTVDQAISFPDATGNYVTLAFSPIPSLAGPWSITAWLMNNAPSVAHVSSGLCALSVVNGAQWLRFGMHTTGQFSAEGNSGAAFGGDHLAVDFVIGTPIHCAITRSGAGTVLLYVNGVSVAFTSSPHTSPDNNNIGVGKRSDGSAYWYGTIDELRVWSTYELTPTEVIEMMNFTGVTTGLPTATTLYDIINVG